MKGGGFEGTDRQPGGGLAVTGNYPGKARTPAESRADFEEAISLIPQFTPAQLACQLHRGVWMQS